MKIDLFQKHDDMMEPATIGSKEGYYPSFNFTTKEDHELPSEGEMTIRFKKTSSGEEERDGKTIYRCTVEVQTILGIKGGKGKGGKPEGEVEEDDEEDNEDEEGEEDEAEEAEAEEQPKNKKRPAAVSAVLERPEY